MTSDDELVTLIGHWHSLPGNSTGGKLHIVLDDPNYEDEHIEFCRNQGPPPFDDDSYGTEQDFAPTFQAIIDALLERTVAERESVIGRYWRSPQ